MDQIEGDVPGEYISVQSLNEEACVEASERDYGGGTNESSREEATGRGQEKRPEKRSQERSQRSGEEAREEVKEEIPADDVGGQNPEVAL